MRRLTIPPQVCARCGKRATTSFWRSHSHHRVKRVIQPNLIFRFGRWQCAKCLKTMKKTTQKTS